MYACVGVFYDGDGHGVFLREGKKGTDSVGFGSQHAYYDHNLYENVIERTIEISQRGTKQSNGRYLYGEYFASKKLPEVPLEKVVIIEQRTPGGGDNYELGVVTAYCADAGGKEQSKCPSWVNEEL